MVVIYYLCNLCTLIASNYNKTIQDLHNLCYGKRECYNFTIYATDHEIKIQNNRKCEKCKHIHVIAYLLLSAFDAHSNLYLAGNLVYLLMQEGFSTLLQNGLDQPMTATFSELQQLGYLWKELLWMMVCFLEIVVMHACLMS